MAEIHEERKKALNRFCGYGNPEKAKIFFMGIEEHHVLQEPDVDKLISASKAIGSVKYFTLPISLLDTGLQKANGTTEKAQRDIYRALHGNSQSEDEIFRNEIHCFNFYPLGSPRLEVFPPGYADLFSFKSKENMRDYFDKERPAVLKAFIEDHISSKKNLLFVFGTSHGAKVKELLFPGITFHSYNGWKHKRGRPSPIAWNYNKTIWLTGHPSHGWLNEEVISKIRDEVKSRN